MANLFKRIYTGTLAKYNAKEVKEENSLYLVYDESTGVKSMYKGTLKVGGDFIIVDGPAPESPEKGVIYYISAFVKEEGQTGKPFVGFWDGTKWVALSDQATIDALDARLDILEGDDTTKGSVMKTVKDAIEALDVTDTEVAGSVVVAVKEENGKVSNEKKAVAVTKQETPTAGHQATYDVTIGTTSVGKIDIPFCDAVLENAVLADMNATVNPETGEVTPGSPKGNDALVMVFKKGNGEYVDVKVDISKILVESEFKSGLAVSENGEVSVKLVANNDYLKFGTAAEGENAPLEANVVTLAEAQEEDAEAGKSKVTGLADALDVKKAIEGKNVSVGDGDEYVTPSTDNKNKVDVAATNKTKNAVTLAETSVQEVVEASENQEVTVAAEPVAAEGETPAGTKVTIGVTKAAYTKATDDKKTNGEFTAEGLVDSALLKQYVADEIAQNAVYWETL